MTVSKSIALPQFFEAATSLSSEIPARAYDALMQSLNWALSPPRKALRARQEVGRLTEPPLYWDVDSYSVQGIDVPVYAAEAKDPIVEFPFCTGFNSTPLAYILPIRIMNQHGISVVATKLLHRDELDHASPDELISFQRDSTEQFFSNPQIGKTNSGATKILGTHSAAGGHFGYHITDEKKLAQISQKFSGAIHMAPFLGVANASLHFYPKLYKKFRRHAEENFDKKPCETLEGLAYTRWNNAWGEPWVFSAADEPTYGEILALMDQSLETIRQHQKLPWRPALYQHFVIPENDTASCSKTEKMFANAVGGSITGLEKTYHNPILESQELHLKRLINRLIIAKDLPATPEGQHVKYKNAPETIAERLVHYGLER